MSNARAKAKFEKVLRFYERDNVETLYDGLSAASPARDWPNKRALALVETIKHDIKDGVAHLSVSIPYSGKTWQFRALTEEIKVIINPLRQPLEEATTDCF